MTEDPVKKNKCWKKRKKKELQYKTVPQNHLCPRKIVIADSVNEQYFPVWFAELQEKLQLMENVIFTCNLTFD